MRLIRVTVMWCLVPFWIVSLVTSTLLTSAIRGLNSGD